MGRPSKFDREHAIDQALEAIWSSGYEQASVKALSELLGITRSSFYNAFGSREALFTEVVARYARDTPDAPLHAEVSGPVLPLINAVFRDICRARASDPEGRGCVIVNSVSEVCPSHDEPGAMLADLVLSSVRRVEHLLALARAGGEIAAETDVHALALALQNLMIGLNVLCKVVRSEAELWLLTRTTLEGLGVAVETEHA
jgi:TetR/AcrR family transcriptional repressor of nem operon